MSKDKRQVFWPIRQGPLDCPLVLGASGREMAENHHFFSLSCAAYTFFREIFLIFTIILLISRLLRSALVLLRCYYLFLAHSCFVNPLSRYNRVLIHAMESIHGQFDNVTDDDIWPQDDNEVRDSLSPRHQVDSYREYDEARRLLRDMNDNYNRRRERGFLAHAGSDSEPLDYHRPCSSNEDFSALPSSSPRPPVDYVRPSDSFHRGRSPAYRETARPPAFESGQFSHGGHSSGSKRMRFADRSPPPVSPSRSHDPDFDDSHSSRYSKGKSRLGRFSWCLAHPNQIFYSLFLVNYMFYQGSLDNPT